MWTTNESRHAPPRARRVCIATTGGDAPGLNAAVRAFVHRAHRLGMLVFGGREGFEGMCAAGGLVPLGIEAVRGILPLGGSMLGCSTRVYPFRSPVGPTPEDMAPAMIECLRAAGIEALVLAGGDGSMRAALRFHALGMPCVGIPKTIDCDLAGTDATCGHDTAVQTVTDAIDALHATAEAHQRVLVVEVMGRSAGWIALRSAIAGGADVVLLPEIPYDVHRVAAKVKEREARGLRFTIVVVGEGARPIGEDVATVERAHPGRLARLGGAGERLREELEAFHLGHEVRVTVLGHLQRGGQPVASDRLLASRLGVAAANACARGELGCLVRVRGGRVELAPLEETLASPALVDTAGELVDVATALGIEIGR